MKRPFAWFFTGPLVDVMWNLCKTGADISQLPQLPLVPTNQARYPTGLESG
jgi:hypothetical protein